MKVSKLKRRRLVGSKRAFTTRRVPASDMRTLIAGDVRPRPGNLVLATVDLIGKHQRIELPSGRRARMFPGDEIIVAYGNRYAPDQFEALVPEDLGGCDLVAGGGIAAKEVCRHERMPEPTRILPIGLIGHAEGEPLNLNEYKVPLGVKGASIPTVIVAGTAMNAGKTTTAAALVRGFKIAGLKVAGIKATGTGSGGDLWFMSDMGAHRVFDFTDAGYASTYKLDAGAVEEATLGLIGLAADTGCDFAVVEIADGLQQEETARLLGSRRLRALSHGVVFAAYDALGASAGVETLNELGHRVFAISGQLTRSPLAIREARAAIELPVFSPFELQAGALYSAILDREHANGVNGESLDGAVSNGVAVNGSGDGVISLRERPRVLRSRKQSRTDLVRWLEGPGALINDEGSAHSSKGLTGPIEAAELA